MSSRTKADLKAENEALREQNERLRERIVALEIRDFEKAAALREYRELYEAGIREELEK